MTLNAALLITAVIATALFIISRGLSSKLSKLCVLILSFAWLTQLALGFIKIKIGCSRMFGDCYVDSFPFDLFLAEPLAGLFLFVSWILCGLSITHLAIKNFRLTKCNSKLPKNKH